MAEQSARHHMRPVWAEVDVAAVRHNTTLLRSTVSPAELCVVVKADGYGHGAQAVARAALQGGATWLAVALVEEGVALRQAGIEAPVLVLSEPPSSAMAVLVEHRLTPTVYSHSAVSALQSAAVGTGAVVGAHLKVDTGMHRVGADPDDVLGIVEAMAATENVRFDALYTHLCVADSLAGDDVAFTAAQLAVFAEVRQALQGAGHRVPMAHAANSAGAIAHRDARLDMVRCGIAVYGLLPSPELAGLFGAVGELQPVMSLRARVSWVRPLSAGERPSYGRRRPLERDSLVATVPIGYADGVPRRYFEAGGHVLVGGHRRPLAGTVTMDQIMVDCGPADDGAVAVGDEVVLIGSQAEQSISAWQWAQDLGTIAYEVVCGIGPRVPRLVVDRAR